MMTNKSAILLGLALSLGLISSSIHAAKAKDNQDVNPGVITIVNNTGSDLSFMAPTEGVTPCVEVYYSPLFVMSQKYPVKISAGTSWSTSIYGIQNENCHPQTYYPIQVEVGMFCSSTFATDRDPILTFVWHNNLPASPQSKNNPSITDLIMYKNQDSIATRTAGGTITINNKNSDVSYDFCRKK